MLSFVANITKLITMTVQKKFVVQKATQVLCQVFHVP